MPKHNAHEKMKLVRHEPGRKRKQIIQITLLVVICSSVTYYAGVYGMQHRHTAAVNSLNDLASQHRLVLDEKTNLQQQVANLEQSEAINDRAKQEIQTTISELRDKVAQLQKDVTFYQNIMAPSKNSKGLQIQTVELSASPENRRYAYKIILAQVASNRNYVNGVVAVNLVGKQGNESVVIPLRDVSAVKELGMKFRFRYFQEFDGELVLPEAFVPEQLQVVAQSKGKQSSRIELNSDWNELVPLTKES